MAAHGTGKQSGKPNWVYRWVFRQGQCRAPQSKAMQRTAKQSKAPESKAVSPKRVYRWVFRQTQRERKEMPIKQANISITGISPLLLNNPQTVDRFNPYAREMARINAKKNKRTDDDYIELHDIEMRSKIYWDDDLRIYIPTTWVSASIAANSFRVAKTSKADIRGCVFTDSTRAKLEYRDSNKVKAPEDIVKNDVFRHMMTLKQGQVRVVKAVPIFHEWSFAVGIDFDDKILDPDSLVRVLEYSAKYGGFGDFRPTFGRASAEVSIG